MDAQDLLERLGKGEKLEPQGQVIGYRPQPSEIQDMICDCDPDGECCGY